MSNSEIQLRVTDTVALGGRIIDGFPTVQVFSKGQQSMKPALAALYRKKDYMEGVYIEYSDNSGGKWVSLESLQRDNNNAIRVLLSGKAE